MEQSVDVGGALLQLVAKQQPDDAAAWVMLVGVGGASGATASVTFGRLPVR